MPVENGESVGNGQTQVDESGVSKLGVIPPEDGGSRSPATLDQRERPTNDDVAAATDMNNATPILNGKFPPSASRAENESPHGKDAPSAKKTDGSASFLRAARAGNLDKVLEFLKTNTDINTCNANGLNALHLASKEGHTNVVSALLERNANVDSATKKGNTALHIASLAGQEEIVKVLVENGATVNIQSQNGFTPLYMAAQENHDSVVRFLLAHGANQSLATEDGFTPLAVALQQGHDRVVSVLLENDTRGKVRLPALHIAAKKDDAKAAALLLHTDHNPDITSKSGFTPLHIASHYGNDNIAALLIQRGADVNYVAKHQITPLHVASKWGKGNMVSLLLDRGANIEAKTRDGLTPLHCAARSGHETVVDMLLEKGAPITAKTKNGLAPLHMASQGDHVDAARILLYHKAPVDDVTVDFLTALHVAAHCGHVRVAKLLLDRKADPNARALNGFTPLHIACKKNRIKVVELLLKHGASIEATTESGLTPLHVASFMGCMNIVIYLIQHGASADVPTVRGESPLHLAARANQTDIIRILLRNGAEVDAKAREQQTALHIASRLGNTDIVGLLLQQGASVDAPTKDLYTPLHIAAKEGQEEVAGVLLDHGASLNTPTKKGFTPLHLAAKYGHMKVARLLLQREAPVDPKGKNGVTPLHVAAHYDHQNVAMLLLDKGAQPHATAKNGYTPLHIAARKNQMDIAGTLLEYGANANAESKAGFTPLHLSAQEGHKDMATLLLEHGAQAGGAAKNGLTPLHLCAQEDRVPVGAVLVKHGASVDAKTKAGYTPLHVAAHFGQMNMVRFLLQHGTEVDAATQLGYTPLHQAAQQGHTQIVNLLLENKAQPNMETNDGKTALSIAQRLGYISVVETLKVVTETRVQTNTTTTTEEKYKVVVPETMHETFMSESEDEGADDTMLGDQSYRYLTVDEMKSLGDDSLPIDVTRDEKMMDVSFQSNVLLASAPPGEQHLTPQHKKEILYTQNLPTDNVDVGKAPILAGPESLNTTMNTSYNPADEESLIVNDESRSGVPDQGTTLDSQSPATVTQKTTQNAEPSNIWDQFLVSFMVDARGGAMRGCRHSGVRVIIPPRKAAMPMRITCRYLKKDKLVHAPPLMEGEALASRILEMGPSGAKFLGPVIIEVPHFASLRGKEREIVILRSDNGETWREHTLEATEEAVQEVLNESFDGEELKQLEDLNTNRITRILTTDFPQYFAIVTRIRQEVHAIGPEGGMVSSTVVPQVQAVFPQGALTKKIKVGLQAQPISTDLVAKLLGNRVAVSPIVTVEPRRRKFHKPITLTIPVPQAASKGMINQYSGEAPTLRLLCSITGGTTRAQWEDVTGSTPLTFVNDCVSFTTTVSARFWLMDCTNIPEATKMATELYREAIHVPFMAKFVVFGKRHQMEEARIRVFCMTDDKEDKTLESQEHFIEVAKSRDVEVLEGKSQYLEFAGNLIPVTKSGDQLAFNFYAFRENRLPFTVRVKDQNSDPVGRVAFMRQPKVGRGEAPQNPICNLNLTLPDNIQPEPAPSEPDLLALEKKYAFLSISKADTIHKADLRLSDISNMLTGDWVALAKELEISDSDINIIKSQYPDNIPQQAIVMLRLWMQTAGNKATGNTLEKALRSIQRDDIVDECICNIEVVTDDSEKATAEEMIESSAETPHEVAPIKREPSPPHVSYEEKDMMKEAESADEEEISQKIIPVPYGQEDEVSEMPIVPQPRSSTIQPTSQVVVDSLEEKAHDGDEDVEKVAESYLMEEQESSSFTESARDVNIKEEESELEHGGICDDSFISDVQSSKTEISQETTRKDDLDFDCYEEFSKKVPDHLEEDQSQQSGSLTDHTQSYTVEFVEKQEDDPVTDFAGKETPKTEVFLSEDLGDAEQVPTKHVQSEIIQKESFIVESSRDARDVEMSPKTESFLTESTDFEQDFKEFSRADTDLRNYDIGDEHVEDSNIKDYYQEKTGQEFIQPDQRTSELVSQDDTIIERYPESNEEGAFIPTEIKKETEALLQSENQSLFIGDEEDKDTETIHKLDSPKEDDEQVLESKICETDSLVVECSKDESYQEKSPKDESQLIHKDLTPFTPESFATESTEYEYDFEDAPKTDTDLGNDDLKDEHLEDSDIKDYYQEKTEKDFIQPDQRMDEIVSEDDIIESYPESKEESIFISTEMKEKETTILPQTETLAYDEEDKDIETIHEVDSTIEDEKQMPESRISETDSLVVESIKDESYQEKSPKDENQLVHEDLTSFTSESDSQTFTVQEISATESERGLIKEEDGLKLNMESLKEIETDSKFSSDEEYKLESEAPIDQERSGDKTAPDDFIQEVETIKYQTEPQFNPALLPCEEEFETEKLVESAIENIGESSFISEPGVESKQGDIIVKADMGDDSAESLSFYNKGFQDFSFDEKEQPHFQSENIPENFEQKSLQEQMKLNEHFDSLVEHEPIQEEFIRPDDREREVEAETLVLDKPESSVHLESSEDVIMISEAPEDLDEAVAQDGFTQPSGDATQMVSGELAPSDVKPSIPAVEQDTEIKATKTAIGYEASETPPVEELREISQSEDTVTSIITFPKQGENDANADDALQICKLESKDSETVSTENFTESSGSQAESEESLSHSANRPTTLKITSASNELNENEFKTNDSRSKTGEIESTSEESCNVLGSQSEGCPKAPSEIRNEEFAAISLERAPQRTEESSDIVSRSERPGRPPIRSAAVLKVKVEKRPVSNHPQRERCSFVSYKETVQSVPQVSSLTASPSKSKKINIEDEVSDLMAEVKEATSQIKREVRQLRESETPTPDTPTPLREFREFLCKEEEQELGRLPTITETGKETEEEGTSGTIPGETECESLTFKTISTGCTFAGEDRLPLNDDDKSCNTDYSKDENVKSLPIKPKSTATFPGFINAYRFKPFNIEGSTVENLDDVDSLSLPRKSNWYSIISKAKRSRPPDCRAPAIISEDPDSINSDLNSLFMRKNVVSVSSGNACVNCTKDYMLNDVCNDVNNIISIVEDGIKLSKNLNIDKMICDLDALKSKIGNIFSSSLSVYSKCDDTYSQGVRANYYFQNKISSYFSNDIKYNDTFGEKTLVEDINMPSIETSESDKEPLLTVQYLVPESNGQEHLTDVEDLYSEGEVSPQLTPSQIKKQLVKKDSEDQKTTDEESVEGSGDELETEKELPTIEIDSFLPANSQEVLSFTEGFVREPSPLLSDCDNENVNIDKRHSRNVKRAVHKAMSLESQEVPQNLTDEENMTDSINDNISDDNDCDTTLPDYYLQEDDSFSNHEIVKSVSPVSKHEFGTKKGRSGKVKETLAIQEEHEGNTDVEYVANESKSVKKTEKLKKRRTKSKKPKDTKNIPNISFTLVPTPNNEEGVTDTEMLEGSEETSSSSEDSDDGNDLLVPVGDLDELTDTENMNASDIEDEDLIPKPVQKSEPSVIPEPFNENIKISENENTEKEDPQIDTDEEGFQLDDRVDEEPLQKKVISYDKEETDKPNHSDSGEEEEEALTDLDDVNIEEKDDEDIINDMIQRVPKEDTNILLEMDSSSDFVSNSKSESPKPEIEPKDLTLSLANDVEAVTDVEEWDDKGGVTKVKKKSKPKPSRESSDTETESIEESDTEEERHVVKKKCQKYTKGTRRLPLVPQLSEVKLVQTNQGPLSIIITPDGASDPMKDMEKNMKDVEFLDTGDSDNGLTDVEEMGGALDSADDSKVSQNITLVPDSDEEPVTDIEDFEVPDSLVINRPDTPIPPDAPNLPSPKREKIYIVEDEYGVPHVKIENLDDDEADRAVEEEQNLTDSENVEFDEDEAINLIDPVDSDGEASNILMGVDVTEVSTKTKNKKNRKPALNIPDAEDGHTDIEEISPQRKGKRREKAKRNVPEVTNDDESDTDVENLDDEHKANIPILTIELDDKSETDYEQFETSGGEESEAPPLKECAATPEVVRKSAVKRTIIYKEKPGGTFKTEIQEENQSGKFLTLGEEPSGTTDVEDVEISEGEEALEDSFRKRGATPNLPDNEESNISVSVKTVPHSKEAEESQIKENLLLPDPQGSHTDVESLDEGEGTEDATPQTQTKTDDDTKAEAGSKSSFKEADLAVLDSILATQEAELEEMTFAQSLKKSQKEKNRHQTSKTTGESPLQEGKTKPKSTKKSPPPVPPRTFIPEQVKPKQAESLLLEKVKKSNLEGEVHTSSDEGEEQLALMKDSPRWEEEEIQNEETSEERPIKAEIKLLVKTTEVGKESIEIRSIREFVDKNANKEGDQSKDISAEDVSKNLPPDRDPGDKKQSTRQKLVSKGRDSSPRFVRPTEGDLSLHEEGNDDFDLMAQVRESSKSEDIPEEKQKKIPQ